MENQGNADSVTTAQMTFASATTTERNIIEASQSLVEQVEAQLGETDIDMAIAFMSPHFRVDAANLARSLRASLKPQVLLGSTAEGVIGRDEEIERQPAITLVAARLPGVELIPFSLQSNNWEHLLNDPDAFRQTVGAPDTAKLFMMVADPFTTPMDAILAAFNNYYTGLPLIGGLASGSSRPGGNALLLNGRLLNNGAVGVAFSGNFEVDVIVSQGCRPIGQALKVTKADKNMIFSLEGETPLTHLQKLLEQLSPEDKALLNNGLFIGRAIAPGQETLGRGDFLIRGVMGIHQASEAIVVGDNIDNGEMVQFHLRDASTAKEDLEMMLTPQLFYEPPSGGLLFSCNGRGTRLYDHPNGDVETIQGILGNINLAGFFCAGEIGPIGGKNFLHGHTASMVLFRPQATED